ncbi:MAG: ASCH domain-containing protein [Pseudomonadota bacterium]
MVTLEELKKRYPGAEVFSFGDTPELIAVLTDLVRSGVKRATCSAVADIDAGKQEVPQIGRRDIVLDADGAPAFVIETLELRETTWETITEEMALAEGENETLEGWRADHKRYFERHGIFAPDMKLLWERFEVIEDFGAEA